MTRSFSARFVRLAATVAVLGLTGGVAHAAGTSAALRQSTSGSIVFQHGGNIFIGRPDGSRLRQVTHLKTGDGYDYPTQTNSGQIVAQRGLTTIVKMDRNGKQIGTALKVATGPNNAQALHTFVFDPDVSPNGQEVAASIVLYEGVYDPSTGLSGTQAQAQTLDYYRFSPAKRIRQLLLGGTDLMSPFWVNNSKLLVFAPYNISAPQVYTSTPTGTDRNWFADTLDGDGILDRQTLDKGEMTRDGKYLAAVRGTDLKSDWRGASIEVYSVAGFGQDPTPLCALPAQHGAYGKVTWSPDGTTPAWSDSNGVWESAVDPSASNCGFAPKLVFKGGTNPDWGPTGMSG
jgi:hypothetical protein